MSKYKNQHYIPKAVLRNFCHTGEQLWYYDRDRPRKGVEPRNIASVFYQKHAATIWKHGERYPVADYSVEEFFGKIETRLPVLILELSKFLSGHRKGDLVPSEKQHLVQFFYNHMLRTPDVMDEFMETTVSDLGLQESAKNLKWIDNIRAFSLANQNKVVLEELFGGRLAIATPKNPKKQFVVASNPVIRLHQKDRASWKKDEVELWAALTPRLAVGILNEPGSLTAFRLSTHQVREMNVLWARQSMSIAGGSKELVTSLSSSVGEKRLEKHTESLKKKNSKQSSQG